MAGWCVGHMVYLAFLGLFMLQQSFVSVMVFCQLCQLSLLKFILYTATWSHLSLMVQPAILVVAASRNAVRIQGCLENKDIISPFLLCTNPRVLWHSVRCMWNWTCRCQDCADFSRWRFTGWSLSWTEGKSSLILRVAESVMLSSNCFTKVHLNYSVTFDCDNYGHFTIGIIKVLFSCRLFLFLLF